jgi:hypothetical protein
MADRVEWFDVTVGSGTALASAVETATAFDPGVVERIELTIPDGHAGLTGLQFMIAHQQIIPFTPGSFIVGNDRVISWDTTNFLDNGAWSVLCYNTDVFDHTFHVTYLVNETSLSETATATSGSQLVVVGGTPQLYTGSTGTSAVPGTPVG